MSSGQRAFPVRLPLVWLRSRVFWLRGARLENERRRSRWEELVTSGRRGGDGWRGWTMGGVELRGPRALSPRLSLIRRWKLMLNIENVVQQIVEHRSPLTRFRPAPSLKAMVCFNSRELIILTTPIRPIETIPPLQLVPRPKQLEFDDLCLDNLDFVTLVRRPRHRPPLAALLYRTHWRMSTCEDSATEPDP